MARLFVIGGGGREHALVWHLRSHDPLGRVYCAPGNPGMAPIADCLPIRVTDHAALADAAREIAADLTIVGPEAPLVAGIVDLFSARGVPIFGPSSSAAVLEGSKVFAKHLMRRYGIPTARHAAFRDLGAALAHLDAVQGPVVIKADGLAAGKGVFVCDDPGQARRAAHAMLAEGALGDAGREILIEERLAGDEVSVFALVDGEAVALLPAAQDHKRIGDGDRGPNTGGMGAAAPYPLSAALRRRILREIVNPVAAAMCAEGRPYRGILFAGLMLTADGPKVLEFNCRLGDPETQVLLPLLPMALPQAHEALRAGHLDPEALADTGTGAAVGVVLATRGYPASAETGHPIEGLEAAAADALVFHSGTAVDGDRLVTAGGRVVTIVGCGATVAEAQGRAYLAASRVWFEGRQYRRDIGARLLQAPVPAG